MAGLVRLAMSSLRVNVPRRIRLEPLLALYGAINLLRRDRPLFHKAVRNHCCERPVEEVQDPVVNASKAYPQFVDSVAQKIRFGSTQLVAQLAEPLQSEVALVLLRSKSIRNVAKLEPGCARRWPGDSVLSRNC